MTTAAEGFQANREAVIGELEEFARRDPRVLALWLEGSLADGTDDALSDVDARLSIDDASFDAVWAQRRDLVAQLRPVLVAFDVYFPGLHGIECVLEGPVKLDLIFERASSVDTPNRTAVHMLVDKQSLESTLKTGYRYPTETAVQRMTTLFGTTRQGATWPVRLLLRGQWATFAMVELELINDNLAMLMAAQVDLQLLYKNRLSMPRLLPAERREQLEELTQAFTAAFTQRDLPALLAVHLRVNDAIVRESRAAYAAFGVPYPVSEEADAKLRAFYQREWPGLE
jgi:predicted nucleotidyltransferase